MKLGLVTPVLTLNPRAHNAWEEEAGFDDVVAIAEAADRLGWHHLTCSEHVAVPRHVRPPGALLPRPSLRLRRLPRGPPRRPGPRPHLDRRADGAFPAAGGRAW